MKSEWKTGRLSDLAIFKNGKKRPNESGHFPVYGGNGVLDHVSISNYENIAIIGRVGAYCGSVYYEPYECWVSDNAIATIALGNSDIKYIYYLLSSLQLNKQHIGTSQPLLTQEILNSIPVTLPSLSEQRAIAATLSCLDDKIEINNKINANLEAQAQAIFKSWFVDFEPFKDGEFVDSELGSIPKGWAITTFNDLIISSIAGDWGKDSSLGNYTQEVYCIRGADIPCIIQGDIGKMPLRFILPSNYEKKKIYAGDLVVEISGGSPTQSTGRIVAISDALIARYNKNLICTNFCKTLSIKNGYSRFVYNYWSYLYKQNTMYSFENGTTGIKNFDLKGFTESFLIIIPPFNIIENFNEITNKTTNIIYNNGLQSENLIAIRDALLPKLMNGEIEVPL